MLGIPALFRWLSTKYPKVTSQCVEEKPREEFGVIVPVDYSQSNPNGTEFDNLYLDMNGIIHPCCHPEDRPAPNTEDEMMVEIFKYIDRILGIIRPRKVLYMAIDGVAPRAKMNQQRSRRFRASQEAADKAEEEEKLKLEWERQHGPMEIEGGKQAAFDSNCITPGTPFMANLAVALRYYISDRLNKDPAWKDLKIILSDASVPGEGEHKIMDFIRRERIQKDYNPNTSHVLYGLDADLIMLALATHEPHFKILREDVFFNQNNNTRGCFICGQTDHQASECTGKKKEKNGEFDEKGKVVEKPYVFLHVATLREYLAAELFVANTPFAWDMERAYDDWVFLCFFVGNDFLPHIPSLEIREGAIDTLIDIWKRNLHSFGGYITNCGDIDLTRAQVLLVELGRVEDDVFVQRRNDEERKRQARIRRKLEQKARQAGIPRVNAAGFVQSNWKNKEKDRLAVAYDMSAVQSFSVKDFAAEKAKAAAEEVPVELKNAANKAAAEALKRSLMGLPASEGVKRKADDDLDGPPGEAKKPAIDGGVTVDDEEEEEVLEEGGGVVLDDDDVEETTVVVVHPKPVIKPDDDDEEPEDNVRLWEAGWKKRYYEKKFFVDEGDKPFIREVVTRYVEGFCWVLKYYYQGCQSWKWYYPYHYSPFASDFDFIGTLDIKFDLGTPFNPIEQLMGVFPAASRQHIPKVFHSLMLDETSPIIDFYPEKFPLDLNGKKYAWQGVALLPFIDESRLLKEMQPLYPLLTEEETIRNTKGNEVVYAREGNPFFEDMCDLYAKQPQKPVPIVPANSQKLLGYLLPDPNATLPGSTFSNPLETMPDALPDIHDTRALSAVFIMPEAPASGKFPSVLLKGLKLPEPQLNQDDIYWVKMSADSNRSGPGHAGFGNRGRGRGGFGNRGRGGGYGGNGAANRFIQHGTGNQGGLPYMGGGGYNNATPAYAVDNHRQNNHSNNNSYNNSNDRGYNNNDRGYSNNNGGRYRDNRGGSYSSGGYGGGGGYGSSNSGGYAPSTNSGGYNAGGSNSGGYNASSNYGSYAPPAPSAGFGPGGGGSGGYGSSLYGAPPPRPPGIPPPRPYGVVPSRLPGAPPGGFAPPPGVPPPRPAGLPPRPPMNLAWGRNIQSSADANRGGRGGSQGGR
ncbi:UNVERIFIED_CONTAM: 5'-3' exoribonuclease 2 [Siphonaria sp. JEL0065]|nr:5'-3' exoribonuclease 2 [Siphonaria sp. JEL0065]